jgi:predicted MarR family transcription regulator
MPENTGAEEQKWHLGHTDTEQAIGEFEHALLCSAVAFFRFIELVGDRSGDTLGQKLNGQDIACLHIIATRSRPKSIPEIAHILNRDDISNVQYTVRKLIKSGLIEPASTQNPRGKAYQITDEGQGYTQRYAELRKEFLADPANSNLESNEQLHAATETMDYMTGLFDQATRHLATRT